VKKVVSGSTHLVFGLGPLPPSRGIGFLSRPPFYNRNISDGRHDPTVIGIAEAFAQIEVHGVDVESIYVPPDAYAYLRSVGLPLVDQRQLPDGSYETLLLGATLHSTPAIPPGSFVLVPEDLISTQLVPEG